MLVVVVDFGEIVVGHVDGIFGGGSAAAQRRATVAVGFRLRRHRLVGCQLQRLLALLSYFVQFKMVCLPPASILAIFAEFFRFEN